MNEMAICLFIIPLVALGYALYLSPWWVRWLWPRVRYCFARKQTSRARVIELQVKYPFYLRDGGWIRTLDEEIFHTHYGTFRLADGSERTMRISKADYQGILTGTEGMLTHKGNWFLSFEKIK